ncbi:hypothetical protein F4703DRAFT_1879763 [Phycomyces blakesleeanus]
MDDTLDDILRLLSQIEHNQPLTFIFDSPQLTPIHDALRRIADQKSKSLATSYGFYSDQTPPPDENDNEDQYSRISSQYTLAPPTDKPESFVSCQSLDGISEQACSCAEEVTRVSRAISQGRLDQRLLHCPFHSVSQFTCAYNTMAEHLEQVVLDIINSLTDTCHHETTLVERHKNDQVLLPTGHLKGAWLRLACHVNKLSLDYQNTVKQVTRVSQAAQAAQAALATAERAATETTLLSGNFLNSVDQKLQNNFGTLQSTSTTALLFPNSNKSNYNNSHVAENRKDFHELGTKKTKDDNSNNDDDEYRSLAEEINFLASSITTDVTAMTDNIRAFESSDGGDESNQKSSLGSLSSVRKGEFFNKRTINTMADQVTRIQSEHFFLFCFE